MPEENHHLCTECAERYKLHGFATQPNLWCLHEWERAKELNKKIKQTKKK